MANNNVPREYCSLHGPAAKPLPLAISTEDVGVVDRAGIASAQQQVSNLLKAMEGDISLLRNKVSSLWFADSIEILKKIDGNMDTLYATQRQIDASWKVFQEVDEAKDSWSDFAKGTEPLAEIWREYGSQLWEMYEQEASPQAKTAYKVIAFRVMRLSGKSYEMAAVGNGRAGKFRKSAKLWTQAAQESQVVMERKFSSGAKTSHVAFYRYQASSRLNRASYYWALDNNEGNVLEALAQAQKLSGQEEMRTLLVAEEQEDDSSGVATQ